MTTYYKRINRPYFEFSEKMLARYEELKAKEGVITSSDAEGEFLLYPMSMDGEFMCSCVTREDVMYRGYNPDKLSDADMECIADNMGEGFCDDGIYWDLLDNNLENLGVERIEDNEDEED